jgi:tryptophan-rich hypothetical protein
MNRINPKKLVLSKWTAVKPVRKEKHFMVTEVDYDEAGTVMSCTIEAVLSKRPMVIQWRDLQDSERWLQGWK